MTAIQTSPEKIVMSPLFYLLGMNASSILANTRTWSKIRNLFTYSAWKTQHRKRKKENESDGNDSGFVSIKKRKRMEWRPEMSER